MSEKVTVFETKKDEESLKSLIRKIRTTNSSEYEVRDISPGKFLISKRVCTPTPSFAVEVMDSKIYTEGDLVDFIAKILIKDDIEFVTRQAECFPPDPFI